MHTSTFDRIPRSSSAAGLSRRATLRGLGGAGLAAITLALGTRRAHAQDAAVPPLFEVWLAAWNGDLDRADTLYADDAVFEDVPVEVTYQGRDQIKGHMEEIAFGFPDHTYELVSSVVAGDRAAAEVRLTATYTETLPGFPPATGQSVTLPAAVFFELAGDQIVREAHYFDAYSLLAQLGALPAMGAEGGEMEGEGDAEGTPAP